MADNYDYNGEYRLRVGTWAANQLNSSHAIASLPRQADQPGIMDWLEPLEQSDIYRDFTEIIISMDGSGKKHGEPNFTWFSSAWSPMMIDYFITQFPGGAVTAMTFDAGKGWRTVNAIQQPIDKTQGQRVGFGYIRIPIKFVSVTEAAAGFAFNEDFNNDFDAPG